MTPEELKGQILIYQADLKDQKITEDEYRELMRNLDIARRINDNAADFERDEEIRAWIVQAMNAALIIYP